MRQAVNRRWYDNPLRWSGESDWWWGPFTYSRSEYRPFSIILSSWGGGEDDDRPANLHLSWFWGTLIIRMPRWIASPHITKVYPSDPQWKAPSGEVYKRLGREYYEDIDVCEYGITISNAGMVGGSERHLSINYGRSTMDSSTEKRWGCFLPWTMWRHVRISYYGLNGEEIGTIWDDAERMKVGSNKFDAQRDLEALTPKQRFTFTFTDFDGEPLIATTHIEEREWRRGQGWFKWMSWFWRPHTRRTLSIEFSGETGKRKGSWKGGTVGSGIDMRPDDTHLTAFIRYCRENQMAWVGWAEERNDGAHVLPRP